MAEYFPTTEWRVRARLGITYGNNDTEVFYSPEDTRFEDTEALKKGEYTSTNTRLNQAEGELSVTWAKVLGVHRINLVAGEISMQASLWFRGIRHKVSLMGILPILLSRTDTRNTEFPRFTRVFLAL